jgi:RNA polymerase-binding transcription factor DksA
MNDYTQHKKRLEDELAELKTELTKIGVQDTKDSSGWSVKNPEFDITPGDENEAGDKNEELHINAIILDELTVRTKNVERALKKIEDNTYGVCEVCKEPVEEDRLQANPAARTCKEHLSDLEISD